MNRNLDGIYFRVKRGDEYENVCFTDLTDEELERISVERLASWWQGVAMHLRGRLRDIGEQFDIVGE